MNLKEKVFEITSYKRGERPNAHNMFPRWSNDPRPPRHIKTKIQKKRNGIKTNLKLLIKFHFLVMKYLVIQVRIIIFQNIEE